MTLQVEIFPADLDATADFYVTVLGFELVRDEREAEPGYLALERDGVRIGAARRAGQPAGEQRRPPIGVEIVLDVDDLELERARVAAAGWPVAQDLTSQPWGLRDFRLLDPSGYYLRITQR
jgi:predicted enzyme related to lactoylglutathione lyase